VPFKDSTAKTKSSLGTALQGRGQDVLVELDAQLDNLKAQVAGAEAKKNALLLQVWHSLTSTLDLTAHRIGFCTAKLHHG
jgi:ribosomal protein S4